MMNTTIGSRLFGLGLCLGALCCAVPAFAQSVDDASRGAARKLGYAGVEAYQAGQFEVAAERLEKSYRVLKVPSLGLWSARALVKLGRWVEASERYREVQRLDTSSGDATVLKQAQAEAVTELEALTPKIPNVVVRIEGGEPAEVQVTIDGRPLSSDLIGEPTPANPGTHTVKAKRGDEELSVSVMLAAAEEKSVVLRFTHGPLAGAAAAAAPGSGGAGQPSRPGVDQPLPRAGNVRGTLAFVSLGLGGAGLVLGGITAGMAVSKKSAIDADPSCRADVCASGGAIDGTVNAYNGLRTISTVGFIVGGVLAGSGLVLLLTAPRREEAHESVAVAAWATPNSAGISGRF